MKKIISLISSIVLAAGMTTALAANAEEEKKIEIDYKPSFYFKAEEGTGVEVLKYGTVFVNKTVAGEGAKVSASVYFKDDDKCAGQVFAKWNCDNPDLQLTDLTGPFAKAGNCPFKITGISSDADLVNTMDTFPDLNMLIINYMDTNVMRPMQLAGSASDDYPLAYFSAKFKDGAAGGSYDIKMYDDGKTFRTNVAPRFVDNLSISVDIFPAEDSESLRVNASDRKLGDINNDGKIDAVDASGILAAYAKISSNKDSEMTADQMAAADVDGNRKVDAVDASNVLGYYAYISGSGSGTLNEFVKK